MCCLKVKNRNNFNILQSLKIMVSDKIFTQICSFLTQTTYFFCDKKVIKINACFVELNVCLCLSIVLLPYRYYILLLHKVFYKYNPFIINSKKNTFEDIYVVYVLL